MGGLTSGMLKMMGSDVDSAKVARGLTDGIEGLTRALFKNKSAVEGETSWLSRLLGGGAPKKPPVSAEEVAKTANVAPGTVTLPPSKGAGLLASLGRTSTIPGTPTAPASLSSPSPSTAASSPLGALSAAYESKGDASAIGYDVRGGTSYGKYQIAAAPGTMDTFLEHLDKTSPEAAKRLRAAGPMNTGSTTGAAPAEFKRLVSEGLITDQIQHDFIKKTHYDAAFKQLSPEAQAKVNSSKTFKDMFWSRAVSSPVNAAKDFNAVTIDQQKEGFDDNTFIDRSYDKRLERSKSSPDAAKGLGNRFGTGVMSERSKAKQMLAEEKTGADAKQAAAQVGIPNSDTLDPTTLNMPVKTAQGIKTPLQMGIKTQSELQTRGGQAFAGGKNDAATTFITAQIMKETGATSLNAQNDLYHQKNAPASGHTQGVKTDFSYAGLSDAGYKGKHAEISSILDSKYGMKEGKDFKIISDPHGTGRHIDFKLNPSGQKKAEAARQAEVTKMETAAIPSAEINKIEPPRIALAVPASTAKADVVTMASPSDPITSVSKGSASIEGFQARKNAKIVSTRPQAPESAADIKAKTPPPPVADNSGIEKRLDMLAQAQTTKVQDQGSKADDQGPPTIPLDFDDYTLRLWAQDRA